MKITMEYGTFSGHLIQLMLSIHPRMFRLAERTNKGKIGVLIAFRKLFWFSLRANRTQSNCQISMCETILNGLICFNFQ